MMTGAKPDFKVNNITSSLSITAGNRTNERMLPLFFFSEVSPLNLGKTGKWLLKHVFQIFQLLLEIEKCFSHIRVEIKIDRLRHCWLQLKQGGTGMFQEILKKSETYISNIYVKNV